MVLDFLDADGQGANPATLKTRYLHGNAVDQVFAQEADGGDVLWLLQDNLGSVRDVVNNAGNVIDRINYDAFGNILSSVNPSASNAATALATRFLFTGQEWDADAHLYYYNARWYDPATGTFISKDPLGFDAGDMNLYRYVGNSPTNFVDPSGLKCKCSFPGTVIYFDEFADAVRGKGDSIKGNATDTATKLAASLFGKGFVAKQIYKRLLYAPMTIANIALFSGQARGKRLAGLECDQNGHINLISRSGKIEQKHRVSDPDAPVNMKSPNSTYSAWQERRLCDDWCSFYDNAYIVYQAALVK